MKNLIRLVKINLLTFFDINKVIKAKTKKEALREAPKVGLILFAFIYFGYMIYTMAKFVMKGFVMLNISNMLLPLFMAILSVYLIFTTIFRVNKTVFNAKDYDILCSLPIKKTTIISSKLIVLYFSNLVYTLIFMIPSYIAYIKAVDTNIIFHIFYFVSLVFIPIVPTVIGSLIGTALTGVSSKFKHKNLASIILSVVLMIGIMTLSSQADKLSVEVIANIGNSIMEKFNSYYPLTKVYLGLVEGKWLSFALFILISIVIYQIFKYFVVMFFDKLNSNLKAVTVINKYNSSMIKINGGFNSLYKKELKKYFSSPIYVLNTGIGSIMLILVVVGYSIFGGAKIETLLEMPGLSSAIALYGPIVFGAFCGLSCTTHSSISLEGKNFWILKTLPISIKEVFLSKILVNLTIILPTIFICAIFLTFKLHLSIVTFLLLLFTPFMYSLVVSMFGLILNLMFPDFNWTNEVKVIKQSIPSFVSVMVGLIVAIIPITIKDHYNPTVYSFVIGLIVLVINVGLYFILKTYGEKRFKAI